MATRVRLTFLILVTALAVTLTFFLARSFIGPILTALVLAVSFRPAYHWFRDRVFRGRAAWGALATLLLIILLIVVPVSFIVMTITGEILHVYDVAKEQVQSTGNGGVSGMMDWADKYVNQFREKLRLPQFEWRQPLQARLQDVGQLALKWTGSLIGNTSGLLLDAGVAFFTLFFFLTQGGNAKEGLRSYLPLKPEQTERLLSGIQSTLISSVYGTISVAAVQGALTGLGFWFVGLPSPVLWGSIAAFFSLLPAVGAPIVWIPGVIYLLVSGQVVQAIILGVWSGLIVGSIDNFLRPWLMSGKEDLHPLLLFFAILGGVEVFGILGVFVGPVVLGTTVTLLQMLREELWARGIKDDDGIKEPGEVWTPTTTT